MERSGPGDRHFQPLDVLLLQTYAVLRNICNKKSEEARKIDLPLGSSMYGVCHRPNYYKLGARRYSMSRSAIPVVLVGRQPEVGKVVTENLKPEVEGLCNSFIIQKVVELNSVGSDSFYLDARSC